MRLTGDPEAASDLTQTCAVRALASLASPAEQGAMRSWLFKIIRNAWIDDFRRTKGKVAELPADAFENSWRYDDQLIAELTVRQAMERIDPVHREVVTLIDLAGYRYAEAAEILGVPIGTVMSRLSRARLALLENIERNGAPANEAKKRHEE